MIHPGIKILDFRQNGILILRLSPDWIKIITNIKAKRTKSDDIKTTGAILQDFFATSFPSSIFGGFQLLNLIITELKSHTTC